MTQRTEALPPQPILREDVLAAMLLAMNDDAYLAYFPLTKKHQYADLGKTALAEQHSEIRIMLEALSHGVWAELTKLGYHR